MADLLTIVRRGRTLLWTALSIIIIFLAVIVGLGKLLMPYSARYQPQLEAWLSDEFGRPVTLERFSGDWNAFGPQLAIEGLRFTSADGGPGTLVIGQAVIDIKPFNLLIPSRALYDFRVVGADFHLVHVADGGFEFSGLGVRRGERKGDSESPLRQIASISEVILEDSSFRYDDEVHDIHLDLRHIDGRLQVRGDVLFAEIGFRLAHGSAGRVSGELKATARLTLDNEQHPRSASWKLSGHELMLGQLRDRLPRSEYFPQQGRLNTEMWGEWDRVQQHRVRGVVDLRDARVVNPELDRSVKRVNTRFIWHFNGPDQWRLDLSDLLFEDARSAWEISSLALGRSLSAGAGLWVSADAVPMETPAEIARDVVRALGKDWPQYLPGRGEGVVRDFELTLNREMKLILLRGHFNAASVSDWDKWPDISNVDGVLDFGFRRGGLDLSGRDVVIEWPRMFAAPLTADLPSCLLNFTWTGRKGEYQVDLRQCAVENDFVAASGEMRFVGNDGKPAADVLVHAERLDAGAVADYWPRALLKERVVTWLQGGLLEGRLDSGRLQIHGDMDDWPFDQGQGRFEVIAEIHGAEVDYFEGWPRASGVDGQVRFVNSGMDIEGNVADIGGVSAEAIRARIDDFRNPELRVDYRSESELPGLIRFLRRSPVAERVGTDLSRFTFAGPASTSGTLHVPFRQGGAGVRLDGRLALQANVFEAPELGFTLTGISGTVTYHEAGFQGEGLEATYLGSPARLSIEAGGEQAADEPDDHPGESAGGAFTARLSGEFDVDEVLPAQLLESWPPLERVEGRSRWEARLEAGGSAETPAGGAKLTLSSDLEGVAISLPAPLDKPASAAWPFSLTLPLQGDSRLLELSLADVVGVRMMIGEGWSAPSSAAVRLGPGAAELPTTGNFSLGGQSSLIDVDGWIGLVIEQARRGKGLGGLKLEAGTLAAAEMHLLDRRFEDVGLYFSTADEVLNAAFDAEAINGKINFIGAGRGSQSLSAEFERLVLDEPMTSGMEMDVDPSSLPSLHLYAKSFRYGDVELGETRIEAYPTSEGFHFEKVEAESPHMSVRASGDWALQASQHRSSFNIHMGSESLGDFLRHLDIASPMEGGQTLVDFNVWWDGSPAQFRLARLNGEVTFSVNTGVISNASPGSGRLLGLLSVQSLPKRLALDFRDVFDAGFAFDEAKGSFTMLNGSARTDDVTLKSSAANISFSGTTDLVAREYNQLITVRPGLGNTLPVIGAIAGGPGGAAAGLALQGLLHDELGEASQVQYTLTGAWDEPQIQPVLKTRADG